MGSRSSHTTQEGEDAFCLLEMNVLWCEMCKSITTAKDRVKMLEETGTKVSIFTVKRVLYRQPERPLSKEEATAPKQPWKKPDYGLQLHMGTKIILFG